MSYKMAACPCDTVWRCNSNGRGADTMQMVPSVFAGKGQNDLRTLCTHLKGKKHKHF